MTGFENWFRFDGCFESMLNREVDLRWRWMAYDVSRVGYGLAIVLLN